jgi:hypothetical protein
LRWADSEEEQGDSARCGIHYSSQAACLPSETTETSAVEKINRSNELILHKVLELS